MKCMKVWKKTYMAGGQLIRLGIPAPCPDRLESFQGQHRIIFLRSLLNQLMACQIESMNRMNRMNAGWNGMGPQEYCLHPKRPKSTKKRKKGIELI